MKFIKLGKIFDPTEHVLPNACKYFAQSPQTIVFDNFVRIYFSTRSVDSNGKYLSHIAFIDMAKNLHDIISISKSTVMPLGGLGCFDEHGIFPINLVRDGTRILAYTTGWNRRVSVSVDTAIGLGFSNDDGLTFDRYGSGPVLAASLHEPYLVGDGFVKIINKVWHMWYIFGTKWKKYNCDSSPERTYKIGHATSFDGIEWFKESRSIITDMIGPDESQALPSVIDIAGRYHMFFCFRETVDFRKTKGRGYRIGHAYSDNLTKWVRDDKNPCLEGTANEWDSEMQCYPHIFECDGKIYLIYNGNEFGRYGFGLAKLEL